MLGVGTMSIVSMCWTCGIFMVFCTLHHKHLNCTWSTSTVFWILRMRPLDCAK